MIYTFPKKYCLGLFINRNEILKKHSFFINKKGGRNNQGKITVNHKGGGSRKLFRIVDFKRKKKYLQIKSTNYDPYRTALIANCFNCYILKTQDISHQVIVSKKKSSKFYSGYCTQIKYIPAGFLIHNIEVNKNSGGRLSRSYGSFAKLIMHSNHLSKIELNSGEVRYTNNNCLATIGKLQGSQKRKLRKAGEARWRGRRPIVRGVAMNPVDHPHGGGEGKSTGGRIPVTVLGKLAKGVKTRRRPINRNIVVNRKNSK